ncbi:5'/3'-nucleotidase SurE [Pseudomonas sp. LS44]|uniref:5'/3'-nucleotidase SurE n=1 Tax=Pseudomonas sp. LS44 TaxID=1357074 RepID=UPI00215B078D|nr:5'/3'-nucleotidase SurE [Pseudomonas sp. LS44]UVE17421.1 5'/3'-nucleotidase SurE [Pseudomonas sp. LS44]
MKQLLAASLALAGFALTQPAQALNIMLTNDDGCRAAGINAVYTALVGAGHQVTLIGPLYDSSGISAASAVTPGQALSVTELAPGKFCVGPPEGYTPPAGKTSAIGTPVDAVNVGLGLLLKDNPPDLVVSGTNFGENVGPTSQMSGTVNAAVRAMFRGVPAIAVSTEFDMALYMKDRTAAFLKTQNALDDTANFVVKVIDKAGAAAAQAQQICEKSKGKAKPFCEMNVLGLPGTTGLSINYPAREAAEVAGVSYAPIGDWGIWNYAPQRGADGVLRLNLVAPTTPTAAQQQADAYQLSLGKAVITVIDGNMTALPLPQAQAELILKGLEP